MTKKLSIAIPTKGRIKPLLYNLKKLNEEADRAKTLTKPLMVHISDSSAEGIANQIDLGLYPYISIDLAHNPSTKKFVDNLKSAVMMTDSEYVWLMGDDDFVAPDSIDIIIKLLNNSANFIHLNANLTYNDIPTDAKQLVKFDDVDNDRSDLMHYHTLEDMAYLSCLIFKSEIIKNISIWNRIKSTEVASHLRFVSHAINQGNCTYSKSPAIYIDKRPTLVAEWNGFWCVLLGYEIPRARSDILAHNSPSSKKHRNLKRRSLKSYMIELRMHCILCVFRGTYANLSEDASTFIHEFRSIRIIKYIIYQFTFWKPCRLVLKSIISLLDDRAKFLSV